jgi:RimJ/RimL family protein N-acetyltransferase
MEQKLKKVDRHLICDADLNNKEFLRSKILLYWDNVERFLDTGIGYALVNQDEITSICCSGFVAGHTHAIDIETVEKHRRKGCAEIVAHQFVKECVDRRLKPHWDCMQENTASAVLAEKIGFRKDKTYALYGFPLLRKT